MAEEEGGRLNAPSSGSAAVDQEGGDGKDSIRDALVTSSQAEGWTDGRHGQD